MYEAMSYDTVLQGMINRVVQHNPNLDVREGSIIYNALAPAAMELMQMYLELNLVLDETFADTASRQMLIKRAAERGITPQKATKAELKAEFNIDVPIGSRFSQDKLNYVTVEKMQEGIFRLQCEDFGSVGNNNLGTMIPINYIEGLTKAELTAILIPGEDDEDTESLRKRYYDSLNSEAFGGNITDYIQKTKSLAGVGGVKVSPAWNGGGTVKLVIINSDFKVPSQALINRVQEIIDPVQNQGDGVGIAPIGHVVTVADVKESPIDINTTITYESGWAWEDVKAQAEKVIDAYFAELSQDWADEENLVVRISQIETRLLGLSGIVDVMDTTINGGESNMVLEAERIPIRGKINE